MSVIFGSILLSLYFSSLVTFSFVSHPVSYCLLLLLSAFSLSGYWYLLAGFSWYLVLFCLVYVGGVYVLFILISVHNPNPIASIGGGFWLILFLSTFSFFLFLFFVGALPVFFEESHQLCCMYEGLSYCFFCLVLMLGFVIVSVVCGDKSSFFR